VHGVGGVGKTTLLGALAAIALIGLGASILLPANPEQ
jgi:signal recognition particle GTPase